MRNYALMVGGEWVVNNSFFLRNLSNQTMRFREVIAILDVTGYNLKRSSHFVLVKINNWFAVSVRRSGYGCTLKAAKHERSVRVALGDSRV